MQNELDANSGRRNMNKLLSHVIGAVVASSVIAVSSGALGQDAISRWAPTQDMRIIVSSGVGSGFDVIARAAGKLWRKYFGVDLIVQNNAGAGGTLSLDSVNKARADGQTIGLMSSSPYLEQLQEPTFPWNVRDFPIFLGNDTPPVGVLTGTKSGFMNWKDVQNAKRKIVVVRFGKLNIDIPAIKDLLGHKVEVTTAQFGNAAPINAAIESGDAQLWSSVTSITSMEPVKEGRMRVLYVYSDTRLPYLPDVPTHLELGMPAEWINTVVMRLWYAPIGTPPHILASLQERLTRLLNDPEISKWALDTGLVYKIISGEEAKQKQLGMFKILTDNFDIVKEYGG